MAALLKYKEYCIVEKAPSHDGAPTFASYWSPPPVPEGDAKEPVRPVWSHRIYDTTPILKDNELKGVAAALAEVSKRDMVLPQHPWPWNARPRRGRQAPHARRRHG